MTNNNCKGCSASVRVDAGKMYENMKKALLTEEGCVSLEEYNQRIKICSSCPSLMYETTCRHCGCLIHMKAINKDSYCPYPGEQKW